MCLRRYLRLELRLPRARPSPVRALAGPWGRVAGLCPLPERPTRVGVARGREGGLNGEMRKAIRTPTMQSSRSRYWTPEEDAVLRKFYPGKGYRACRAHLPCRGDGAIASRAQLLGLPGRIEKKKKDNPERAMRRCLGPCGEMFVSEHIGHRMCRACLAHAERIGIDRASFTGGRG